MGRLNKGNAAEYQHSAENAARLRRIGPAGRLAAAGARAARLADKARWQQPVTIQPTDKRTREYREWLAKQLA